MVKFFNKIIDAVLKFLHLSKYKEIIVYIIVGGLTTVVDWAVFALVRIFAPEIDLGWLTTIIPNIIATTLAWLAAVIFSFFANRILVFNSNGNKWIEFLKFVLSRLLALFIPWGCDALLCGVFGMNEYLMKAISSVVVIVVNYITGKVFVFTKKKKEEKEGIVEEKTDVESK